MPHGGSPETIEARRAQILERPSTLTPTAAAALGRSRQIEENCVALKRQRRFFLDFVFGKTQSALRCFHVGQKASRSAILASSNYLNFL